MSHYYITVNSEMRKGYLFVGLIVNFDKYEVGGIETLAFVTDW